MSTVKDPAVLWADVVLATELLAVDPVGLGGVVLRAGPGPQRDRVCALLREVLPPEAPVLRLPLDITDDRLLGGLSLAATLDTGTLVTDRGLLSSAAGGVLVVAMAERLEARVTSTLCAALDHREIVVERDGISARVACPIAVLALDEGIDDERAPAALLDRLAIHLDLDALDLRSAPVVGADPLRTACARLLLEDVVPSNEVIAALCQAAHTLGIASVRAPIHAAHVARAHAALEGRTSVEEEDAAVAARLVLGPLATRLLAPPEPEPEEGSESPAPADAPPPDAASPPADPTDPSNSADEPAQARAQGALDEVVLAAAHSAIPAGLLELFLLGQEPRSPRRSAGHAGSLRASNGGGRPAGTRPGAPRSGDRLDVVETLRAAAPWQTLRRRERARAARRIEIRKDDLRIRRFQQRTETRVIFVVDASGSSAMQRLAEAKGAVERVLADCYVRRDHVALISFRGTGAQLLLPPTRSLARVRRSLAQLAGGGTTPVASGIDAALALAEDARKRGQTPVLVFMTDGRANIGLRGREGGVLANADATTSARAVRAAGVRTLFLDTSPRSRPQARQLATEMGARYLPLPHVDAAGISRAIQTLAETAS